MKRLLIYYQKKSRIFAGNIRFLNAMSSYADSICVAASLQTEFPDDMPKLDKVLISPEKSTISGYENSLASYSEEELRQFDRIIFCNSDLLGPISSCDDFFAAMEQSSADVFYLEDIYAGHKLSHYMFAIAPRCLPQKLADIITKNTDLSYQKFFDDDNDDDFYLSNIRNHITKRRSPFVFAEIFATDPLVMLRNSMGIIPWQIFSYIKEKTDFDTTLLLDYLVANYKMSTLRQNLHLNYILPADGAPYKSAAKTALICYIYYADLIDYCYQYALSMPDDADIYIITCKDELTAACRKAFADFPCHALQVIQMENRGRDVAAYLVAARDVFAKYDYVCCMHDKKSPQFTETIGQDFSYHLFECNLSSKAYVGNIIKTFDENPRLGMLVPPFVNFGRVQTIQKQMASEGEAVKSLLEQMNFSVPYDEDVVAPLGTMFWVRGKAFLPMFKHQWQHTDFPAEPNPPTGTLLHAIERFYPFAVQEAGYFVGLTSPVGYSAQYADSIYWFYKELLKSVRRNNSPKEAMLLNICPLQNRQIVTLRSEICDELTLCANGVELERANNLTANLECLANAGRGYVFFAIPEEIWRCPRIKLELRCNSGVIHLNLLGNYLPDERLLVRQGKHLRVKKGRIYIENKRKFFNFFLPSLKHNGLKLIYLLSLICRKKYTLFCELEYLANNSAFELFKYSLKRDKNCYYLIDKKHKKSITGVPSSHVVAQNSLKHFWLLCNMKRAVCDYGRRPLEHRWLSPEAASFFDYELIYTWHGISCGDKNSIDIYRYILGTPDLCCCCSEYEKEFFSQKCEYPNVVVTGYPRMDKWTREPVDDKQIFIFFTWRRNLSDKARFLSSCYYSHIKQILAEFSQEKYRGYHITFSFYHHMYQLFSDVIEKELMPNLPANITLLSNMDTDNFNQAFAKAKYVITDISSAAFDNAYKDGALSIYYIPKDSDFIGNHFVLQKEFYERHLGVIVDSIAQISEIILEGKVDTAQIAERRQKFFRYFDGKNCERVYDAINEYSKAAHD